MPGSAGRLNCPCLAWEGAEGRDGRKRRGATSASSCWSWPTRRRSGCSHSVQERVGGIRVLTGEKTPTRRSRAWSRKLRTNLYRRSDCCDRDSYDGGALGPQRRELCVRTRIILNTPRKRQWYNITALTRQSNDAASTCDHSLCRVLRHPDIHPGRVT